MHLGVQRGGGVGRLRGGVEVPTATVLRLDALLELRVEDESSVVRFLLVEVLRSALRHGVRDEDIQHALENALLVEEIDDDPTRYLVLGPDRAAKLLELVVLDRPQGPAVIHAMPMRARYRSLLERRT